METKQPKNVDARRQPKTRRGRDTRDEILAAARKLVSERWIHETPFTQLATEAHVARASLLHAFPQWRDVVYTLLEEELGRLDVSFAAAQALKRARPGERVYAMLAVLLDRAEITGRLYANLRSEMFTWHGLPTKEEDEGPPMAPWSAEMTAQALVISLKEHYESVERLLQVQMNEAPSEFDPMPLGECLVNLALDLAAGSPSYWAEFDDRRQTLRRNIELIAAGLGSTGPRKKKKKRKR